MDTDFHFTCLNTFGMAGLYGKCILNFVRDCQTVFQNGFTILHSYSNGGEFQRAPMVTVFCFVAVVQSLSHVWLFVTPWTAARQAFLSFTIFHLFVLLSTKRESLQHCNYFLFLLSVLCFCFTVCWTFVTSCICVEEHFVFFVNWSSHDDEVLFAQVLNSALSAEKAMPAFLFKT